MAFYHDVRKGEKFNPSALMFNDIARSFNNIDGFRAGEITKSDDGSIRVAVINTNDKTMPAHSAVCIVGPRISVAPENKPDHQFAYEVSKYYANSSIKNWCVLEETLAPGEIGTAVLCGVTEVKLSKNIADTNNGFAIPNAEDSNVFDIVNASTQARVLRVNGKNSDGYVTADIILMPFSVTSSGYFKVAVEENNVVIFDGSDPNSEYAGYTDLPNAEKVSKRKLSFPANSPDRSVYLLACYNESSGYYVNFSFDHNNEKDCFYYLLIAEVSHKNGIKQIYQDNSALIFKKDFYL